MFTRRRIDKLKEGRDVYGLIVALWHRRTSMRREAALALAELGDQRAVAPLIGALGDEKRSVRVAAAHGLATASRPARRGTSDRCA